MILALSKVHVAVLIFNCQLKFVLGDPRADSRHDAILKYDIKGKLESNANNSGIKLAPCTRNVIYSLCDLHCLISKCLN